MFDIVFFALLAAFLAFKLYNVLGRKGEGDDAPDNLSKYWKNGQQRAKGLAGNVIALPVNGAPAQSVPVIEEPAFSDSVPAHLKPVLDAIHKRDPHFTERQFRRGAEVAFEMILSAFAKGDKATLEPLLSSDIYTDFTQDINARAQQGEQLDITIVAITNADIIDATLTQGTASVTVHFASEQIIVTRDKEGTIIAGNPSQIDHVDDTWTFARQVASSNPNWKLVSTNHTA